MTSFAKKKIIGVQTWKKTPSCLNGPCVVVIMRVNCLVPNVRDPEARNERRKHDKGNCVNCGHPIVGPRK